MPSISSGKVLVTGANGFVAAWTIKTLLDAGFSVRGTVRSLTKAGHLRNIFSSYTGRFEAVAVPDLTKESAFDEAVTGVDAILHTASPVGLTADDPAEMIDPAVNGTLGILRAAASPAGLASIKRVVYLSSCAAVFDQYSTVPRAYTEADWNEADPREVAEKGRGASPLAKYCTSKTFAEQRAWAWYEDHKATLPWDFAVVNPPWVFGPMLHEVGSTPESLNDSNKLLWNAITQGTFLKPAGNCRIDVRDLARALLLTITTPAAGGERFIVSAGPFAWEDFMNAAHKITGKTRLPEASYDPLRFVHLAVYNTKKSEDILGMTYHSLEETTRDVVKDWESRAWL
ncbi:NAD-P-binding protein [Trametes meyenii]|nr:NAD-P-binding protein [Trametes meyenii]